MGTTAPKFNWLPTDAKFVSQHFIETDLGAPKRRWRGVAFTEYRLKNGDIVTVAAPILFVSAHAPLTDVAYAARAAPAAPGATAPKVTDWLIAPLAFVKPQDKGG